MVEEAEERIEMLFKHKIRIGIVCSVQSALSLFAQLYY